ncbi:hypothetical protein SAMD00019534_066410, partial [Acytostelium subglobosum LB1]|uniref:hypothetical protein n=1 Tax=Acytostelium subglobosum LB1 TaxID=1410327 RepID=UPI000644BE43
YFGRHSFVSSAIMAYSNHHHFMMRPEDVWISITTQLSRYLLANKEKVSNLWPGLAIGEHLHTTLIIVENDDPYDFAKRLVTLIIERIHDKSFADWFMPNFTTTTNKDRMVGSMVFASAAHTIHDYEWIWTNCGLPKVTLLGTVEDWQSIRKLADRLLQFDVGDQKMSIWCIYLFPVLDKLIDTALRQPDIEWWRSIVDDRFLESGAISGWITTFVVFDDNGQWQDKQTSVTKEPKWYVPRGDEEDQFPFTLARQFYPPHLPIVRLDHITRGYVSVPFKYTAGSEKVYHGDIVAGHLAVDFVNNNNTISPRL